MHSTSVCVRHASSVEAPTRAVRISTPSVQSILSISYASSSAVYAVGLSMWNEPSPSGHTSSMHVLYWGWPTGAPTCPSHGPASEKYPDHSTLLPHSQMSATRRTLSKVLWLESKWFSMNLSVIICEGRAAGGSAGRPAGAAAGRRGGRGRTLSK